MMNRRKAVGSFGQTGEKGSFRKVQLARVFVKIGPGSRLYPVRSCAEINLVQVKIENLVFAEAAVDPVGEKGLFELTHVSAFGGKKQGFDDLLGYGASPLDDFTSLYVLQHGAKNSDQVHPAVLVEPRILSGYKGLDEIWGKLLERNQVSSLDKEFAYQFTIGRIYAGDQWRVILLQGLHAGKRPIYLQIERKNRDAHDHGKAEEN